MKNKKTFTKKSPEEKEMPLIIETNLTIYLWGCDYQLGIADDVKDLF